MEETIWDLDSNNANQFQCDDKISTTQSSENGFQV